MKDHAPGVRGPLLLLLLFGLAMPIHEVSAQARYDDHPIDDQFFVTLGGFHTPNVRSKLRVNPQGVGIGTIIELEDSLNVEKSLSVVRLDGYFRFNRNHRLEWTYFDQNRRGSTTVLDEEIRIGDVTFPTSYRVDSVLDFEVLKANYAWSFINTARYEFYFGGGLNIRNVSLAFTGEGALAGQSDVRVFEDDGALPLPTVTAGMHYKILDNLSLRFRLENFFIRVNDVSGRWQDTYLLLDYEIGERFGIGGGLNIFNISWGADLDNGYNVQSESDYVGLLLYVSARF